MTCFNPSCCEDTACLSLWAGQEPSVLSSSTEAAWSGSWSLTHPSPRPQVTTPLAKQAEPARRSRAEAPPPRRPGGDLRPQGSSPPPRTSARTSERERRTEKPPERGRAGPRQPPGGWQSQEELPGAPGLHRHLERGWSSQEEGPGLGGWQGLGEPSGGATRALEGTWRGPLRESEESWGQSEAWEKPPSNGVQKPPDRPAQRGRGALQELFGPPQPMSLPENTREGPAEFSNSWRPETDTAMGRGTEGACPHLHGPERRLELDWRDLLSLLGMPREGAWARPGEPTLASRLPRLDWEGLLELLQTQLPRKDPAGHWGGPVTAPGPELGSPGTKDALERERQSQPAGWAEATLVNGHSPEQGPQSLAQLPSPACISTQWPKTKVTSGPETSTTAGLETSQLGSRSPAEGPSSADWEVGQSQSSALILPPDQNLSQSPKWPSVIMANPPVRIYYVLHPGVNDLWVFSSFNFHGNLMRKPLIIYK